jgi:hypothetical protein
MEFSLLYEKVSDVIHKKLRHRITKFRKKFVLSVFADSTEELTITMAIDNEKNVNINNIHIYTYKGHGLSYVLIYTMLEFMLENYPELETITLDDMSDKYRLAGENLYMKLGFEYLEKTGPEMIGNLNSVMENCRAQIFK